MSSPVKGVGVEDRWERWRLLIEGAHAQFLDKLLSLRSQHPEMTDYAAANRVDGACGTLPWQWGAASEVLETTNSINAWGSRLHLWNAWNQVVESYGEESERWEVFHHFVEPIAFFCMHQPSSLTDKMALAAENLLHQANQRVFPNQPDRLKQDDLKGGTLRRSDRREQLNKLGQPWSKYPEFRDSLCSMDGAEYKKATRNFRDLTNHAFAPRMMIGHVARAMRSTVTKQELVEHPDGTFQRAEDPTRKSVQYTMSSMEPIPLETAYGANLAEYRKARRAIEAFTALIDELCDRMDQLPKPATP